MNNSSVTVIGYGSLMSELSARLTCEELKNFRTVSINGYKRVFNLVDRHPFINKNYSIPSPLHIAACAAYKCQKTTMLVSAFDVSMNEWQAIKERENCYKFKNIDYQTLDDNSISGKAYIALGYSSHNDYLTSHPDNDYLSHFHSYYDGPIYREDIKPYYPYLKYCLLAAYYLGETVYDNFINSSYLSDQKTLIRDYLEGHPEVFDVTLSHPIENPKLFLRKSNNV